MKGHSPITLMFMPYGVPRSLCPYQTQKKYQALNNHLWSPRHCQYVHIKPKRGTKHVMFNYDHHAMVKMYLWLSNYSGTKGMFLWPSRRQNYSWLLSDFCTLIHKSCTGLNYCPGRRVQKWINATYTKIIIIAQFVISNCVILHMLL